MSFKILGLSEQLVQAVHEKGYTNPSPIQEQAIPVVLKGGDIMACAQTGTGKTAGFTLPMLHMLNKKEASSSKAPRALILAPTRELAAQIHESIQDYGKHLSLRSTIVFGGVKINPQIQKLQNGVDILVATPGRLLDLFQQRAVRLNEVKMLVLDEADRMLDMGFIHDIKKVLAQLPKKRQNLLFSATFSHDIRKFAKGLLHNPVEINVAPQVTSAKSVKHKIHPVDKARKAELLSFLIRDNDWYQALVFCRTKHGANKLVKRLSQDDILALAIHGNKSQLQRTKALDSFKQGKIQVLVATDVAARGIDIDGLGQVVNIDLPNVPEDYVHRIGRTGRAGATGQAISLVSADEIKQLCDIEKVLKQNITRELIDGFEPDHSVPDRLPARRSSEGYKAKRAAVSRRKSEGGQRSERSSERNPRKKADSADTSHDRRKAGSDNRKKKSPNNRTGASRSTGRTGSNNSRSSGAGRTGGSKTRGS
tara:strand:- start:5487 stop:6926 length:1440 start_codon:yes stop_codon:yes gene_type:complete